MKKYIITCIATILGVYFAQADNINVQDVTMDAGQSGTISISLTNSTTNYVSFQMDLYLPNGFTLNKTGNTLSNRFSSGELVVGRQSDGAYRLTATSLALNPITGTSGVLLTLSVKAPSSPASGTANIRNILFAENTYYFVLDTEMSDVSFSLYAKGQQSLSFSSIPTKTYGDAAYTLPSQTDQGLTLTWSVNNTSVATVSGNTLTIKGAGTATVTATQAGNNICYPFTKSYTLTVNKAPLTITAQSYTITYGSSLPTFAATYSGFKNNETSSVLTQQPTFGCSATSSSAPGTYDINVSGAAAQNYTISYVKGRLTINAKNASSLTISSIAAQTYTGSAITPSITVKDGSTTLASGTDYTVAYSNNTNAGTASVTVTGKGNYTGTKTATFTINAKSVSNLTISDIAAVIYNGTAQTPAVTVKDGSTTLTNGTDYTVALSNNTNAGTATVTVTGKGNYTGTKTASFTINAKSVSNLTISDIAAVTYNGTAQTPAITVKDGSTTLTSGTDYTISYSNNTNVGTATVTVTGKGNYTGTKTANFTIEKAQLTVTANSYSVIYGGTLPTYEANYTGFKNNETVSVLTTQPTFSCTATPTSPAGTYDINVSGASAQNYEMIYVKGTLTIEKRNQTITLDDNLVMTYGGGTFTLPEETDQGFLIDWSSGNTAVAAVVGNTLVIKGAGTATLTAEQEGDNNNQPLTKDYTLTVNKAPLTITAQSYTIEQGQSLPTFAATYEGFVNNQTASVLTKQPTFSCEVTNSDVPGTYTITPSGAEAKNYEMSYVAGTLTITEQPACTVTAKSYTIKYGDALPEFEYTSEGFELEGTPELSCEATSASPVGTYPITVTKGSLTNYNVTYVAGTLTIEKAPLKVTVQNADMTYGNALPTFEAAYEGFKNNDDATVLTTTPTMTTTASSLSAVGTYEITASGAEAQNYEMSYVNGTLTIGKAALTVTPKNVSMAYGNALPTFEATYEGFKNDDDATVLTTQPAFTTTATPTSVVGTYEITADGAEAENYVISYGNGTLTVEKAPLTITAQDCTMKQGDPLPAFDATFEGFKNNETSSVLTKQPKFGCEATSASELGTYDIIVSGAEAQNYEMIYVKGTLTITQADPVTLTAKSYTIKYGDDIPMLEFTSDGATLSGTPTLNCEATSTSPVGTYPITVTKGSVENYNVTYVAGTLTIEKAPLTITAQSYTIVQGEAFPEFEAIYDGFKNGETEDVLTRKPSLATLADEYSNPGEYEILVAGARANNYDITYVNGVLTIEEPQTGITTFIARIPDSSVVMRSRNGEITVEGLADGQRVSIHTYGGMLIGSATTVDGKATINTSLTPGSIVIVKVGNKTVKYVVR